MSDIELDALLLSLRVGLASTALCLPFALGVAGLLARTRLPGRALLDGIVHAPLVLPPVVIGYLLLISLGTRAPLGAWLKSTFGIQLIFTTEGVVVAAAVMAFPLMVRAIRLSLDGVDRGLELAARFDRQVDACVVVEEDAVSHRDASARRALTADRSLRSGLGARLHGAAAQRRLRIDHAALHRRPVARAAH